MSRTLDLQFRSLTGLVFLTLKSRKDDVVLRIAEDAEENGEAPFQIGEASEYDYSFVDSGNGRKYQFEEIDGVLERTWSEIGYVPFGRIRTGNYVGTLTFHLVDCTSSSPVSAGELKIEVVSTKTDYRTDYRQMLEEISKDYAELVMSFSPAGQHFLPDSNLSSRTLYQRFAFVKSIVDNDSFSEAVRKIILNPIRNWEQTFVNKSITNVKRLDRKALGQIASSTNRITVKGIPGLSLPQSVDSLPQSIEIPYKRDTIDTPENRFVKYVVKSFVAFVDAFQSYKNASDNLKAEASVLSDKLQNILSVSFFKGISDPSVISLNSPALQRKDGYRDILNAWTLFDTAAKLTWTGGDDVYDAGKKNVSVLYEYWLFFKLLSIISETFSLDPKSQEKMIERDSEGLNLSLKQGRMQMISGSTLIGNRRLNIRFYYNRSFYRETDFKKAGSWTVEMRPDYTLTIWPGDISQKEAEAEEVLTHIHFDAKYRVDRSPFPSSTISKENADKELDEEKLEQESGIYKRADILKMHAYKDAIRHTSGAYILYPGDVDNELRGFHEILPGIGAFNIRPARFEEDARELKRFVSDVVTHLLNRNSRREKVSLAGHQIQGENPSPFTGRFPEVYETGGLFPDTTPVLVGYYKDEDHLRWILTHGQYNIRLGRDRHGVITVDERMVCSKYLLLYDYNDKSKKRFLKILSSAPSVIGKDELGEDYPKPNSQMYLIFNVSESSVEPELAYREWMHFDTIDKLIPTDGSPLVVMYTALFPPQ